MIRGCVTYTASITSLNKTKNQLYKNFTTVPHELQPDEERVRFYGSNLDRDIVVMRCGEQ